MKKWMLWSAVIVCVSGLIGCSKREETRSTAEYSAFSSADNCGIIISAQDISDTGLTLLFENTRLPAGSISFGRAFSIERLEDGEWKEPDTKTDAIFLTDAFVPNKNSWSMDIDWEWLYGKLPAGTYRILKSIDISTGSIGVSVNTIKNETLNVSVEFEVKSED